MPTRSWITLLLLLNYLLVVGMGCVSRSDGQQYVVVQTNEYDGDYQEKGYLRMDSLEKFLVESLASHYTDAPQSETHHHILFLISSIDTHCLPTEFVWPTQLVLFRVNQSVVPYQSAVSIGTCRAAYSPPWEA